MGGYTMGYKSRVHWTSSCLKDCKNRNVKCDKCYRFSEYEEKKPDNKTKQGGGK